MQLSASAINDLKLALNQSLGANFSDKFSDSEVNEIGLLLLTILAEGLKLKASKQISSEKEGQANLV